MRRCRLGKGKGKGEIERTMGGSGFRGDLVKRGWAWTLWSFGARMSGLIRPLCLLAALVFDILDSEIVFGKAERK